MSHDAIASVYTIMLNDRDFSELVAEDSTVLDNWELTDEEKRLLIEDAQSEVQTFSTGGGVMGYIVSNTPLSGPVGSGLGIALNKAQGLPTKNLAGPGLRACSSGCCPWQGAFVAG